MRIKDIILIVLFLILIIIIIILRYKVEYFTLNVTHNKCSDYIEKLFGQKWSNYTASQQSVIGDMWRGTITTDTIDGTISDDIGGCVIPTQIIPQYLISDPSGNNPCSFKDETGNNIMPNGTSLIPVGQNTSMPSVDQNGCMMPFMNDIIPNNDSNGTFNAIIKKAYTNKELTTANQIKEAEERTKILKEETDRITENNMKKSKKLQDFNTSNITLQTSINSMNNTINQNQSKINDDSTSLAALNISIIGNQKSRFKINRNSQLRMVKEKTFTNKPIIQKKMSDGNWYTLIMKYTYGMSKQTQFNNDPFLLYDNAYGTNINIDQISNYSPDMFIQDSLQQYRNNPMLDILMASKGGVIGDSRVIIEVYNDKDRERMSAIEFMHFQTNDYHNWWNANNLNMSDGISETTITGLIGDAKNCNFFSGISGDTNYQRRWFINRGYLGCQNDPGYFGIPYNGGMTNCWDAGYRGMIITARDNAISFGGSGPDKKTIQNYHLGTKMLMWMRKDNIKIDPFQELSDATDLKLMNNINYSLPTQNIPNDTDCGVSDWTSWSACDNTGNQTRNRSIIRKRTGGGADCPNLSDTQKCQPQDCKVTPWSSWSTCDNNGIQTQSRTIISGPQNGGNNCPPLSQTQNCQINCKVGDWGPWSTCDNGKQNKTQNRSIIQQPLNGGASCPPLTQTQNCPSALLFKDCNYKGTTSRVYPGDYSWIENVGMPNDSLSSMQIPNGYYIVLYKDANYKGQSNTYRGNISCLSGGWNDVASSFKFHAG